MPVAAAGEAWEGAAGGAKTAKPAMAEFTIPKI